MTFKKDYADGMKAEATVFCTLKGKFPTVQQTYPSAIVDYFTDDYIFELKKRNCSSKAFPTTIIGLNKLKYADKSTKTLVLLFLFTDGLYYCVYTPKLQYTVKKFVRDKRSDINDKKTDYAFIDTCQLKRFSTFEY
jgi:hypothetical protein